MKAKFKKINFDDIHSFIFVTNGREVLLEEAMELCKKYMDKHFEVTQHGEALFVDLRPAFDSPLQSVTPKTILSVPKDYIPPNL